MLSAGFRCHWYQCNGQRIQLRDWKRKRGRIPAAVTLTETEGVVDTGSSLDYEIRSHMLLVVLRVASMSGDEAEKGLENSKYIFYTRVELEMRRHD